MSARTVLIASLLAWACEAAMSQTTPTVALKPLPSLEVVPYMGTWYQVLWFPNRFQKQCVADTTATYREAGDGTLSVTNRCRLADGSIDSVVGVARPPAGISRLDAGELIPAQLEVSFLPAWLRWTGIGWGAYWVVDRPADGRYAVISEGSRQYLWVLSRKRALTFEDTNAIRAKLVALGFDLTALQAHPHAAP
jgi:apolipoprotein D and lipocalin family protein